MLNWIIVDRTAEQLGASPVARRKWRQRGRGVPSAWRIKIAEHLMQAGHPVCLTDFERLEETPGRIAA